MDVKAVKPMEGYNAVKMSPSANAQLKIQADDTLESAMNAERYQTKDINRQELNELSQELNKFMAEMSAGIQFTVHEKTNSLMVQVVDTVSQRVIKEFPSKEFLDTIANIREYVGFLLDRKA